MMFIKSQNNVILNLMFYTIPLTYCRFQIIYFFIAEIKNLFFFNEK